MLLRLDDEARQVSLGECLGRALEGRGLVYLEGELGAGKTTLARGVLRAYGHRGAVKSPTYTLVEPYELDGVRVHHFDLYRLGDPEELEFIGGRDLLGEDVLCLVEWPGRGEGWLPEPDLRIALSLAEVGREARLEAFTARGEQLLARLAAMPELAASLRKEPDDARGGDTAP
ncbi:tRNA (adenosine(37)-N6)-threonylcarbamoyltransferase complex ATPase subunit type 1 TsaE [Halomonas alkalicola]|jgi:tRNA threonylcarbamoyladenosine biosynthesis protein TsaE|uniref:tRNA threonylcarbamoyladenosine biosynthesis protein TsaE n=1 Tax=Halomonas alkalicola TaxID=1930622 RepID=A0ABY9H3F2_9GAMM|nr:MULTISPECIES: tRNA (adenosine(37)-N6)-threonylcarbamoyltransferase complex ATPase subunit type 1 TsaE [Halomonas]AXY42114.1 tRNA (adenosine(37)-N6)-threonylcarbamoyltransferase complex ATPase subunit type 1 TsaE [Halomonas sp. JS92-SW72]PWV77322.1 tRNA threonylcarbamoyladenosine biosynthesis protein TsaE [Halomonas sp. A11-A]WLI72996.1 tRNA (adenosine(37)-N6)-threonylcarbamoyltransferase complex ATPase subunit type 1 TsaE [Halomonas alkalicola]